LVTRETTIFVFAARGWRAGPIALNTPLSLIGSESRTPGIGDPDCGRALDEQLPPITFPQHACRKCPAARAAPQRDGREISNASDTKSNILSIQARQPDFPQPARITLAVTALDDPFGDDLCEWVCTVGNTEFSQSVLESRCHGL
jgi:hypothetical protein